MKKSIISYQSLVSGILTLVFLALIPGKSFADSCPCCGQVYGNPRPGDEARVNQLRRAHEASCCSKGSRANSGPGSAFDYEAEQRRLREDQKRRQEAEQRGIEQHDRARILREEEARRRLFEQEKQDALELLKTGSSQAGLGVVGETELKNLPANETRTSRTGLPEPALKEPLFSKGSQNSAPTDLKSLDQSRPLTVFPEDVAGEAARLKGLGTNYVPKPVLPSLKDYQYQNKERIDILLDALELGRGDYAVSIRHLTDYLESVERDNPRVQEALSYIQGMAEGHFLRNRIEKQSGLFDPGPSDSEALMEAVAGTPMARLTERNRTPEAYNPKARVMEWEGIRNDIISETVQLLPSDPRKTTREDLQKCVDVMRKRSQDNPNERGVQQALLFFEGVISNY